MGYGGDDSPGDTPPPVDSDELDADVLDNVHLAGARFERMLKKLQG